MDNMMKPTRDREAVAKTIVGHYQQRRARGECRVDDNLYLELCHVLPKEAAQEVFDRFRKRRSRSDPKAEHLLGMEIAIALYDADHNAENFKPIMMEPPVATDVEDFGRPSAAKTYAKALAGQSLTDADENAVLFDELL